jgi:hypothetical protein
MSHLQRRLHILIRRLSQPHRGPALPAPAIVDALKERGRNHAFELLSSGVKLRLAISPSPASVAKIRFTLKAVRSKCGAANTSGNAIAVLVKLSASAIAPCPKNKKAGR